MSRIKPTVLLISDGNEAEPHRALDWGGDDEPVRDARLARLDLPKVVLIQMLEACEWQNKRLCGYTRDYENIQRSDRARIRALEEELDEARGEHIRDARRLVYRLILNAVQQVATLTKEGSRERLVGASLALRQIDENLAFLTSSTLEENSPYLAATVLYRQLCKWACHRPRPDTIGAALYRDEVTYLPTMQIVETEGYACINFDVDDAV